ncbi:MAG: hypothetical protein KO316_09570 [Methanobacterium sp.]|jgi:hypothetical protein|nr:hypothetical protein [Methanobacterium sp.]
MSEDTNLRSKAYVEKNGMGSIFRVNQYHRNIHFHPPHESGSNYVSYQI